MDLRKMRDRAAALWFQHRRRGWTPAVLGAALVGRYEAGLGVTLVGSDIDVWADQSGRGNNWVAASAGVRPLFEAAGLGTGPCGTGDGVGEWLRDTAFSWGAPVSAFSMIFVAQGVTFVSGDTFGGYGASQFRFRQISVDKLNLLGPGSVSSTSTTVHSVARMWSGEWDGATQFFYVNTTLEDSDLNANVAQNDNLVFSAFALSNGTVFANVKIGAVWLVNRVLTTEERASFYAYSQRKGWVA